MILTLLQFIIFVVLLAVGGYWDIVHLLIQMRAPSLNIIPLVKFPITSSHILVANGLIFATALLVLILLFQLLRKKLHPWASLTVLAYVLALCLGFALKLGLPPADNPSQDSQAAMAPATCG